MTSTPILLLHASDNVAVAKTSLAAGLRVNHPEAGVFVVAQAIPAGHKVATRAIRSGETVLKYGQVIGTATADIDAGQHVHVHNVGMGERRAEGGFGAGYRPTVPAQVPATFDGYLRADGRVGTRNYIGVISTVNCSASVCRAIARAFEGAALDAYPGVDGVVSITHGSGCGMSGEGEGIALLRRTLLGYAEHPNFAGVLLVGLGCEVNQIGSLVSSLNPAAAGQMRTISIQQLGGTREAIAEGQAIVAELAARASQLKRVPVPAGQLKVGLQCGGSDGYSGISANPALGAAVDLLVSHGGTAILSETPEIYGAEHLLTHRAATPEIAERLMARLRWWDAYTAKHDAVINNNPSPGNKAGGITTILEKSLGAVAKAGGSGLMGVVEFAESVSGPGLMFMDSPGYDPVSATGQVAGGANLICFTTGRGSTFGSKPTPSLKVASNTEMFRKMSLDMDFNAGEIIDGTMSVATAGERLFQLMLEAASGKRTLSELNGVGDNEFVPWQIGAVV